MKFPHCELWYSTIWKKILISNLFHRKAYGRDQCHCNSPCINCYSSSDYTWFATCSEGVIQGTVFSRENVQIDDKGKFEMKTSNLNGLVNAEKMILMFSNSQYTLRKVWSNKHMCFTAIWLWLCSKSLFLSEQKCSIHFAKLS